jgi:hypothetical protein
MVCAPSGGIVSNPDPDGSIRKAKMTHKKEKKFKKFNVLKSLMFSLGGLETTSEV